MCIKNCALVISCWQVCMPYYCTVSMTHISVPAHTISLDPVLARILVLILGQRVVMSYKLLESKKLSILMIACYCWKLEFDYHRLWTSDSNSFTCIFFVVGCSKPMFHIGTRNANLLGKHTFLLGSRHTEVTTCSMFTLLKWICLCYHKIAYTNIQYRTVPNLIARYSNSSTSLELSKFDQLFPFWRLKAILSSSLLHDGVLCMAVAQDKHLTQWQCGTYYAYTGTSIHVQRAIESRTWAKSTANW